MSKRILALIVVIIQLLSLKAFAYSDETFYAENLEYNEIIDAMENHNLYASMGPEIKELYVEDNKAYLTFSKGEYAVMSTKGRRVKLMMAEVPDDVNKVEFEILPSDGYIRFDVVDKKGKRANTCAYFLEDIL